MRYLSYQLLVVISKRRCFFIIIIKNGYNNFISILWGDYMEHKKVSILLYAVIGFLIISFSIHLGFEYLHELNQWSGLIMGGLILLLSWVIYLFARKIPLLYVVSFVLNMIGVGLSITSYYVFKAYALALEDFMVAYLLAIGLIIIFSMLTYVKFLKRHIKLAISLVVLVSFISSLLLWGTVDEFTGLSFYFLNVSYFYLIAIMSKNESKKDLMREMSIVSFGAFFIASFIVLVVLSEGDALQLIDGADGVFHSTKKKKV